QRVEIGVCFLFEGLSGFEHETLCTSNACFTAHMKKERFDKAKEDCNKRGGYLMTIRDRKEEDVVRSLLPLIKSQRHGTLLEFWIGLKLKETNCVFPDQPLRGFKWVSGNEESHYSNWKEEPASTCLAERCVNIDYNFSSENHLKWTAVPCKKHKAFYACKFYFKGMCEPLALLGPGEIAYTRSCDISNVGYKMMDGKCRDVDECAQRKCEHICLNTIGSFSCFCKEGFAFSEDGHSCEDINECVTDSCSGTQENFTESLTSSTTEHPYPQTDSPIPDPEKVTNKDPLSNTTMATSFAKTINSRVIICVLGSVIPLVVLIAITLFFAIFRCSRSKKEVKKNTTADGYCWVSSGLDPRLEKLYESILTDDP
uniref:Complement component C1q receptor n=1 Tax=Maylandia zebra TaxID=106582 RepID=A0A3P9BGQ8_9CICH